MLNRSLLIIPAFVVLITGCSEKPPLVKVMSTDSNGVIINLTADPDPPQAGSNTFTVSLTDDTTNQPIVNANVTISAYNELAGGGDRESGRSKGDGTYEVPINLGIPDTYQLNVEVQRPEHDDSDAQFTVTAG